MVLNKFYLLSSLRAISTVHASFSHVLLSIEADMSYGSTPRRPTVSIREEHADDEADENADELKELRRAAKEIVGGNKSYLSRSFSRRPILGVEGEDLYPDSLGCGESGVMTVRRPVYSHSNFTKIFEEVDHQPEGANYRFLDTIFVPKKQERPSCEDLLDQALPIIPSMRKYNWRRNFCIDFITGITTGVMRIPQSMAYAFLAKLPPSAGLYTAFFSGLLYVFFGGSKHLVPGAQGVVSLMVGSAVSRFTKHNLTETMPEMADVTPGQVVVAVTFLAGVIQVIMGILRLGFVTNYLSDPLIGGFTTGAACEVVVSQLKDILGLSDINHHGWFATMETIYDVFSKIGETNVATLLISLYAMALLIAVKYANYKLNMRFPIPGELIVMVSVILFSWLTDAHGKWGVNTVSNVAEGFETPELPRPALMGQVIDVSFSTAIVSFAIGYSIAKRLAIKHDYEISGNHEVFAFGIMNTGCSFFHGFVATSSMSVSTLNDALGAVSQLSNMVACILVLFVILFLGFVFEPAPDCVLSCIILINLKGILVQFKDLKVLWRVSKIDFLLWIVTWFAVFFLSVDVGLLIGVAFSLLTVVFRTQWPYSCELGRIPSTDLYKNRTINPEAVQIEGIRIFRFEGSLYFASAEHFRSSLHKETGCNPYKIILNNEHITEKLHAVRHTLLEEVPYQNGNRTGEQLPLVQRNVPEHPIPSIRREVHHIIIDFSTCSFIDSVGLRTLNQCIAEYREAGISVYFANVRAAVRALLFNDAIRSGVKMRKLFLSVHDAVLAAVEASKRRQEGLRELLMSTGPPHHVSRTVSDCEM